MDTIAVFTRTLDYLTEEYYVLAVFAYIHAKLTYGIMLKPCKLMVVGGEQSLALKGIEKMFAYSPGNGKSVIG